MLIQLFQDSTVACIVIRIHYESERYVSPYVHTDYLVLINIICSRVTVREFLEACWGRGSTYFLWDS